MTRQRLVLFSGWNLGNQNVIFPRSPRQTSDWSTFAGLYDQYKVVGMRVTVFFPPPALAVPISTATVTAWPRAAFACYDNDSSCSSPPTLTTTAIVDYDTYRALPTFGSSSYEFSKLPISFVQGVGSCEWLDTAGGSSLLTADSGNVYISSDIAYSGSSTQTMSVLLEYDVCFRARI
jgi:hypothetical protein